MARMATYADLPEQYCRADMSRVAIVPVPYDRTSTWIKGADKGPAAIIDASANLELYDIETDSQVYKQGISTDSPLDVPGPPEQMVAAVQERITTHIQKGKFVVVIGGEHSVSIGSVRAHAAAHPEMTVLQLDAHADLRDEYLGSKYNHACVMARVKESCPIVQVGIRSMDSAELASIDPQGIFYAHDIVGRTDWFDAVVRGLSRHVYVTIDVDVFDPALMPSTGTPEPGGLSWYDVLGLLREVCRRRDVVGFDVVELCPNEHNKAPDFVAAKLIYKLLSYRFSGPNGR